MSPKLLAAPNPWFALPSQSERASDTPEHRLRSRSGEPAGTAALPPAPAPIRPMRIPIDARQAQALNTLRGLPERAHLLLMESDMSTLDGAKKAFDELVAFISDELAEGRVGRRDAEALIELCLRIDPSCSAWLGQ